MPATHILPIDMLVQAFADRSLPLEQWTHEAHLRTALYYLYHHSEAEATCLLRSGIIIYNHHQGGVNTPDNGYHETLTLFWITIISRFIKSHASGNPLAAMEKDFLNCSQADKNLPFSYFSRQRLLSTEARSRWVEPDLQPL